MSKNWRPRVVHDQQSWGFWDAGSGGKKTLFNVCYALAIHKVAIEDGMNVPNVLVIDSPTKNISREENKALVRELYKVIFDLAVGIESELSTQFILIDSDFVEFPENAESAGFVERNMAGTKDAPSLISYYEGP